MQILDLTLTNPYENLALDEALLDQSEGGHSSEIIRFWMPEEYFVVLGYSNKIRREVNLPYCEKAGVPVFRRISGGGTVLQGPGCLNYSLILSVDREEGYESITKTNQKIMAQNAAALEKAAGFKPSVLGDTDLTQGALKFSGNAQRRRKKFLLFHGTFLINFDLNRIEAALNMPERQPSYRKSRSHLEFVTNLNIEAAAIKNALIEVWRGAEELKAIPLARTRELVASTYSTKEWTYKF